jgi:hypothetical protein
MSLLPKLIDNVFTTSNCSAAAAAGEAAAAAAAAAPLCMLAASFCDATLATPALRLNRTMN